MDSSSPSKFPRVFPRCSTHPVVPETFEGLLDRNQPDPRHGRTFSPLPASPETEQSSQTGSPQNAKGMRESWCLSVSRVALAPSVIVNLYGRLHDREAVPLPSRTGASIWVSACGMATPQTISTALCRWLGADAAVHPGNRRRESQNGSPIKVITFKTRVRTLYHQGQSYLQLHPKIPQAQERQAEPLALCCCRCSAAPSRHPQRCVSVACVALHRPAAGRIVAQGWAALRQAQLRPRNHLNRSSPQRSSSQRLAAL